MTRGEAADFLEKCRWWFEPFTSEKEQWNEALDIAVEALTQYSRKVTQDLISRQDAMALVDRPIVPTGDAVYDNAREDERASIKDDLLSLPSTELKTKCIAQIRIDRDDIEDMVNKKVNEIVDKMIEPKKGAWGAHGECPYCDYLRQWDNDNFCANCGADMRG